MSKRNKGIGSSFRNTLPMCIMFAFFIFLSVNANAQSQEEALIIADEMPSFPGGQKALMDAIYKNITYPRDASENGIQGKVTVRFIITKEGTITKPTIAKGLCPSIDKVVLEAIGKLPEFVPGKKDGKAVNVWFAVPVTFKLAE